MANFEKMKTSELEKREDELQREVFAATFKQLSVQLDSDLAILEEKFTRNRDQEALDASRDEKFLRDRQAKLGLNRNHICPFPPTCLIFTGFWTLIV